MDKQPQAPSKTSEESKVKVAAAAASENQVVYKLRDISKGMVEAWKSKFPESYKNVQVS